MTMITPSYLGETIEYSSLHACRSTLEDPTRSILSRYIENPKLYPYRGKEYKYHLRIALLAVVDLRKGRHCRLIMWKKAKIILANRPYTSGDYKNKKIHDTHLSTAAAARRYPEEYVGDADQMTTKIAHMFTRMAEQLMANEVPTKNSKVGVMQWGADVMIDADDRPWLLEVNVNPGWVTRSGDTDMDKCCSPTVTAEGNDFIEMMWTYAYDPLLGFTERPKHSSDFIEVYNSRPDT